MEDFSSLLFGKPLKDVTLEDLKRYFSEPKIETDKIEFKSYPPGRGEGANSELEKKVLRTIVGFLNSEGGVLIWGAPHSTVATGKSKEVFHGELILSDIRHEKDSFIAKIANLIVPSPRGIQFHRIENQGRYGYLFAVPQSEYSPHQTENTYYMRLDGQTVPAPHHYIEALFKRVTFPKIEGYLKIRGYAFENTQKHSRLQCAIVFRNQSPFENDYDLHCRIITSQGKIVIGNEVIVYLDKRIVDGTDRVFEKVADTIYFGNLVYHYFDIIFDRDHLYQVDYEIDLVLAFGARLSPMRHCHYRVKVGPDTPYKWQEAITVKDENRYFHESRGENALSAEDALRKILDDEW